jgi:hypothetical protein
MTTDWKAFATRTRISLKYTKQKAGIALEKPVAHFIEQKMSFGSKVDHHSFDLRFYPNDNHNIVDIVIKDKALVECTNPKASTWLDDITMQNKLEYFLRKDPLHLLLWVLIVAFANFSQHILDEINRLGTVLIVLNLRATPYNFHTVIKRLFHSRLYSLLKRLQKSPFFAKTSKLNNLLNTANPNAVSTVSNLSFSKKLTSLQQHCSTDFAEDRNDSLDSAGAEKEIEQLSKWKEVTRK